MKANPFKKTPNMDSKEREMIQEEELRDEQPEQQLFEEEKTSTPPVSDENPESNEEIATGDSETLLTEEEKLIRQLEEANALIEEQKDKYLRLSAEFDNYRKRTVKEKAELIFNGGEKTINSILPIIDDMERALKTMETSDVTTAIQEGIELIYNKFVSALGQNGVKTIETKDKPLDTDFHEAIAVIPAPSEEQKGKILDCVQTGYTLNDKVIRHAKVVVGE
jgi:molecular chaperone GrpE